MPGLWESAECDNSMTAIFAKLQQGSCEVPSTVLLRCLAVFFKSCLDVFKSCLDVFTATHWYLS